VTPYVFQAFFDDLEIPKPDYFLEADSLPAGLGFFMIIRLLC